MDYSTMQSRVRFRIGTNASDPILTLTDEYVNEALHYLETASSDGWPWMRQSIQMTTTVAAYTFTQLGTLTTNQLAVSKILSVKTLVGGYWYELEYRSVDEADQMYPVEAQQQIPESFSVDGSVLTLLPAPPTAGYSAKIRVVTVEADMSGSGSTPVIPTVFHSAVVDTAAMLMYESLQDQARADAMAKNVNVWVEKMRRYGNQAEESPKIKVREWL